MSASPTTPPNRRGNPNLGLSPRCGARTRAGCPCRAPAIRGKLRCRMHGGRSTGPRTEAGLARLRAARTVHGGYGADTRTWDRHTITHFRRCRVFLAVTLIRDQLPRELLARLDRVPQELLPPPRPSGGSSRAEARAAMQSEAEALAPWKLAIEAARQAMRKAKALPKPHAPVSLAPSSRFP